MLIRKLAGRPGDTVSRRAGSPLPRSRSGRREGYDVIIMRRVVRARSAHSRQVSWIRICWKFPVGRASCSLRRQYFTRPAALIFWETLSGWRIFSSPGLTGDMAPGNSQVGPAAGWYVAMATIHAPSGPQDTAGGRIISVARQLFGEAPLCPPDQWEETVMTPAAGTVTGRLIFPYKLRLCDVSTQF